MVPPFATSSAYTTPLSDPKNATVPFESGVDRSAAAGDVAYDQLATPVVLFTPYITPLVAPASSIVVAEETVTSVGEDDRAVGNV